MCVLCDVWIVYVDGVELVSAVARRCISLAEEEHKLNLIWATVSRTQGPGIRSRRCRALVEALAPGAALYLHTVQSGVRSRVRTAWIVLPFAACASHQVQPRSIGTRLSANFLCPTSSPPGHS